MQNISKKKQLIDSLAFNLSEALSLQEDNKAILESAEENGFDKKEIKALATLKAKQTYLDEVEKLSEKEVVLNTYKELYPLN